MINLDDLPAPQVELGGRRERIWRWFGMLMQVTGGIGVALSLLALLVAPFMVKPASEALEHGLVGVAEFAKSAGATIGLAADSIEDAAAVVTQTGQTMGTTEGAIKDIDPLLESVSLILETQIPEAIESSVEALTGAQEGAQAMDRVLRALAAIQWLTGVEYDPEIPLNEGLADLADRLSPMPKSLRNAGESLSSVAESLDDLQQDLGRVAESLESLGSSLQDISEDVRFRAQQLANQQSPLETAAGNARRSAWIAAGVLALYLFWTAITQAGLIVIGGWMRDKSPP
jgi:ABC-type transporter Mla subunit MlaD